MKKMILTLAAALMVAVSGCTSVQTAEKFNSMPVGESGKVPVAHVNVKMTGSYLFGIFPLFCGSVASDGKTAAFTDTLTVENGVLLLTRSARGMGGNRIYDISTTRSGLFLFPLFSFETLNISGTTAK